MPFQPRRLRRALLLYLSCSLLLMSSPARAAEKMRLRVDDYQIDAELSPHVHKIVARAKVKFTAIEDTNVATFELHNALRVTKVLDMAGKPLSCAPGSQDFICLGKKQTPCATEQRGT